MHHWLKEKLTGEKLENTWNHTETVKKTSERERERRRYISSNGQLVTLHIRQGNHINELMSSNLQSLGKQAYPTGYEDE